MNRTGLALTFGIVLSAAACEAPPPDAEGGDVERAEQSLLFAREVHGAGRTVTNPSNGRAVTVKSWHCQNIDKEAHPIVHCSVDPEYVLVGGSAHTDTGSPGAMLTASYPDATLSTWTAASKDHGVSYPHYLHVIAHGISVKDMTRNDLRQFLTLTVRSSETMAHPKLAASAVPSDKWLLSVGAKVHYGSGPGSMLTGIWPTSVHAKDHVFASPATITMYEVMIAKHLPVANVDVTFTRTESPEVQTGYAYGTAKVLPNYVEVGAFAFSVYWDPGRMLTSHGYTAGRSPMVGYESRTKDHLYQSRGSVLTQMNMMRVY